MQYVLQTGRHPSSPPPYDGRMLPHLRPPIPSRPHTEPPYTSPRHHCCQSERTIQRPSRMAFQARCGIICCKQCVEPGLYFGALVTRMFFYWEGASDIFGERSRWKGWNNICQTHQGKYLSGVTCHNMRSLYTGTLQIHPWHWIRTLF